MVVRAYPITGTGTYYVRHLAEVYVEYLGHSGHGVWTGDALLHFGLTAGEPIDPRALIQLLAGNYPDGRPAVQKQRWKSRKRQAGTDCVYSVPKSVSAIYAASETRKEELSRLLLECVVLSLRDIEGKVAWARRGHGGERLEECKVLWAVMPHDETRPPGPGLLPEPALHLHCLHPSVCVRLDGTTGAGFSHPLYETQRLASVLFDLRTSYALATELGLKVVPEGFSYRVEGVPEPLVSHWSSRSKQIRDRLAEVGDFTPRAAAKAARVRLPKSRVTSDERHARWLETSRSFNFDPEVLFDPTRRSRPPLSEKTQGLAADAAVFAAAEALNFRQDRFTEELLTIQAALRCIGKGVSVEALLAAVERAVTRPLEHGLAPDGEKDGVPLFKRWDAPDPPVVTRLPDANTPHPEAAAPAPPTPGTAPAPGASPESLHHADVNVGADSPVPRHEGGSVDSGGAGVHTYTLAGSSEPGRLDSEPTPSGTRQPSRPDGGLPGGRQPGGPATTPDGSFRPVRRASVQTPPGGPEPSRPVGSDQSDSARLGKLALLLAPVRAWVAVREAAKSLIATDGHFTPTELKARARGPELTLGVPDEVLDRAVARVAANPGLYGLVRVGERAVNHSVPARRRGPAGGKEPVLTSRGQLRLERLLVREAKRLFRAKGWQLKSRHIAVAAGLARGFGAQDVVKRLLGKYRLGLLNAEASEERTVLLRALTNAARRSGGRVRLVAPTGGGAVAAGAELGEAASTVTAFLAQATPTPLLDIVRGVFRNPFRDPFRNPFQSPHLFRKPSDPIRRKDIVVVIDAQSLGTRQLARLLKAARRAKARLILAGTDIGKDSPVAGGGWRFLTSRLPTADIGPAPPREDSPERTAAGLIRSRKSWEAVETLQAAGRVTRAESNFTALRGLLDAYRDGGGLSDPSRHLAVAGTRKDAAKLNRRIQAERGRAGLLGVASVRVADGSRVRRGDRVTFARPNKALGVGTGERGQVTLADPLTGHLRVRTDDDRSITVSVAEYPHLELAYAATAFRAAGMHAAHWYAYVRGPVGSGFDRAGILAVLDRAADSAKVFTPLGRDALAGVFGRASEKSLAVSHRDGGVKPLARAVAQEPVLETAG